MTGNDKQRQAKKCQAPGSTGRADDHVYSLPDFPGYYTKYEFWTGIQANKRGSPQEYELPNPEGTQGYIKYVTLVNHLKLRLVLNALPLTL